MTEQVIEARSPTFNDSVVEWNGLIFGGTERQHIIFILGETPCARSSTGNKYNHILKISRKPFHNQFAFMLLTYHTDFTAPSRAVSLFVASPARINARVVFLLHGADDE